MNDKHFHEKQGVKKRMTPTIETDRLILREVRKDDVEDIFDCWMQDEDVSRYMWWKASHDIAKAQEFVEFELHQMENDKWNRWMIVLKETGEVILERSFGAKDI